MPVVADYTLVDSVAAAVELAGLLNGAARARPVAVITTAAGQTKPYVDVAKIAAELDGLADVYLLPTGPLTWTFSDHMGDSTDVYGGAGRVYPVGHDWVHEVKRSPLRFAWSAADGPPATERLIDDGLRMAAAAGLLGHAASSARTVRRRGEVKRADNERAWVDFGGGGLGDLGIVPPQLAEPDLPIERVLAPGMTVAGAYDPKSRWFDIRASRLTRAQALARYETGAVILAEVVQVRGESAVARIFPSLTVTLSREDVTPGDADLRSLLSAGEVVAARVLSTAPWWLTLLDVDEEPVEAASIYPGGPPWLLLPEPPDPEPEEPEPEPESASAPPATVTAPVRPPPVPEQRKPAFSPARMPPRRGAPVRPAQPPAAPEPAAPEPAPAPAPSAPQAPSAPEKAERSVPGDAGPDLARDVEELRARSKELANRVVALEDELKGVRYEREQLEGLKNDAEDRVAKLEAELKKSRSLLRKASSKRGGDAPEFADRERGFRYLVETAWARRIPVGEQPSRPIPEYLISERFFDSVDAVQGIAPEKIADVVMELVTGIAESSPGRDMHRLRTGTSGDTPARQRDSDGAYCWRLALQTGTPSARRLHAWKLPDGRWELSSVRKHDDFES